MRMLVICLFLGILLFQIPPENPSRLFALIGFLTVTGLTLARLCKRVGLPALLGPLIAGLVLGFTNLTSMTSLNQIVHSYDFALAWVGLFLGAGITPTLITNKRLLLGAVTMFFPPVILMFAFLLFESLPWIQALPLAVLAGIPVILLVPADSKLAGEIIPLAKLSTALGLVLWWILSLDKTHLFGSASAIDIALDITLFIVLLEATVQICKSTKTDIAQHITLFVLAYLLALTSYTREVSTLFLGFPAGVFLSFRKVQTPLLKTPTLSEAILCFVLTVFSLKVVVQNPPLTTYPHVTMLGFYFVILMASKVIGGALAQHFFKFPTKVWLSLLPQGFVALLCFQFSPVTFLTPLNTVSLLGFLIVISAYPACSMIWSKIKKDPLAGHKPSQRAF